MYPSVRLHIAGDWVEGRGGRWGDVVSPVDGAVIGRFSFADVSDVERAAEVAVLGFGEWRRVPAMDRSAILRRAAALLRDRADAIGGLITQEIGRPPVDSRAEVMVGAEVLEWFAEEARRVYGRIVPARREGVTQMVLKEPVGPVAAFSTWNVPVNHVARKAGAALAAGCSLVIKGPEEAPASTAAVVEALLDAGVPGNALGLVFGDPPAISETLIPHPAIRKVTFTGSTPVGKRLAALAGAHMKPITMELGGHAPALIFADADIDRAAGILAATKFRNAGQICISPTRFLVEASVFDRFVEAFVGHAETLRLGDGARDPEVTMGPLAHIRRLEAIEALVTEAVAAGAKARTGGYRVGNEGFFYAPTVLTDVPVDTRIMNEEPFGPVALINAFSSLDEALTEANRLDMGLAAYLYSGSDTTVSAVVDAVESGMVSVNHHGLGPVELPFGGVKESGHGSEGGAEAVEAFLVTKVVSRA
jgi:succinate-semialdehyde dehydrogenase/glutarate-semialdehyde dehydrogenase